MVSRLFFASLVFLFTTQAMADDNAPQTADAEVSAGDSDAGGDAVARRRRQAPPRREVAVRRGDPVSEAPRRQWLASPGIGLFLDPTLFLINAQLEYVVKPHLLLGPLVQLGLGSGTIFTGGATVRILFGHHPKIKPCGEVGLGIGVVGSSVGIHIPVGLGLDYKIDSGIHIGTIIRANFIPPAKTLTVSWPLIMGRFAL